MYGMKRVILLRWNAYATRRCRHVFLMTRGCVVDDDSRDNPRNAIAYETTLHANQTLSAAPVLSLPSEPLVSLLPSEPLVSFSPSAFLA